MGKNLTSNGFIVAGAKAETGAETEIGVSFEGGQVIFTHHDVKYTTIARSGKFFCSLEAKNGAVRKQAICNDYRHILRYILRVSKDDLNIQYGIINIKDMPFLLYVIPNGFLFKLDIEEHAVTYAMVHNSDQVTLAKQNGQWQPDDKQAKTEILGEFDTYYEALNYIYNESLEIVRGIWDANPRAIN